MAALTWTILVISVAAVFMAAKAEPNTGLISILCNSQSYTNEDAFGDNVAYVMADMMNVTPSKDGYFYYTRSPSSTSIAYGHATCTADLANSDCANCLVSARSALNSGCYHRVGAQVALVDCTMRYENYGFA